MAVQVLFQYVLMQNCKKDQLSKITDKDKAQLLTAKQPKTDRESKRKNRQESEKEREGASERGISAISAYTVKTTNGEGQTERRSQIQYQLNPSSLPKSKLP